MPADARAPEPAPGRPVVLHDGVCRICKRMARLMIVLSLGSVRAVAHGSAEALVWTERHPAWRGKLVLIRPRRGGDGYDVRLGPAIYPALPGATLAAWAGAVSRWLFRRRIRGSGARPRAQLTGASTTANQEQ